MSSNAMLALSSVVVASDSSSEQLLAMMEHGYCALHGLCCSGNNIIEFSDHCVAEDHTLRGLYDHRETMAYGWVGAAGGLALTSHQDANVQVRTIEPISVPLDVVMAMDGDSTVAIARAISDIQSFAAVIGSCNVSAETFVTPPVVARSHVSAGAAPHRFDSFYSSASPWHPGGGAGLGDWLQQESPIYMLEPWHEAQRPPMGLGSRFQQLLPVVSASSAAGK